MFSTDRKVAKVTNFLKPEEVCELIPGMTKQGLANLRYRGVGPRYYKPSPRVVVYELGDCLSWLRSTARVSTSQEAS